MPKVTSTMAASVACADTGSSGCETAAGEATPSDQRGFFGDSAKGSMKRPGPVLFAPKPDCDNTSRSRWVSFDTLLGWHLGGLASWAWALLCCAHDHLRERGRRQSDYKRSRRCPPRARGSHPSEEGGSHKTHCCWWWNFPSISTRESRPDVATRASSVSASAEGLPQADEKFVENMHVVTDLEDNSVAGRSPWGLELEEAPSLTDTEVATQNVEGTSARPLLPVKALHRIVSPIARATMPERSGAPVLLPCEAMWNANYPQEPKRPRFAPVVSFRETAEWFYLDLEDGSAPVVEALPLKNDDAWSPRSPCSAASRGQQSFKEVLLGVSTPRAGNAHISSFDDDEEDGTSPLSFSQKAKLCDTVAAMTPKASRQPTTLSFGEQSTVFGSPFGEFGDDEDYSDSPMSASSSSETSNRASEPTTPHGGETRHEDVLLLPLPLGKQPSAPAAVLRPSSGAVCEERREALPMNEFATACPVEAW